MRPTPVRVLACLALAAAVLRVSVVPRPALAEEPTLAIYQEGGACSLYSVGEIERIGFRHDTLSVQLPAGTDYYLAGSVLRIEFLWPSSGVAEPEQAAAMVTAMRLLQNRPNPFSPETRIEFDPARAGHVGLDVYRPDGRHVRSLVDGTFPPGPRSVVWDGRDDDGRKLGAGVYFYVLTVAGETASRRMILLP